MRNNEQDKYQNILTHLHELNRQNLLNENDRNEYLSTELDKINQKISDTNSTKSDNKLILLIILLLVINTGLIILLLIKQPSNITTDHIEEKKTETIIEDKKEIIEETEEATVIDIDANSFNNQEDIIEVEEVYEDFKELTPIIRKGTRYTCKDENSVYRIPFTTDIKGKLFSNRFDFILQQNNTTKECSIKKEDM